MKLLTLGLALFGMAIYKEYVAWFTHKFVMHGFLWTLHEDHHHPKRRGPQKNDWFAVVFALVSFILIYAGLLRSQPLLASAGFGVALYGVGYVLFHDVMFHHRIRGLRIRPRGSYLKNITRAHRSHHRHGRENSTCFGFLYPPRDSAVEDR
jgi:beta-carotene 3-hydroxylase